MVKIKEFGSFLEIDNKRYLINPTSKKKLVSPWKDAVVKIKREYIKNLGKKNIHSIYVRGSVAKGEAIKGISDIDTFCLINCSKDKLDLSWTKNSEEKILKEIPEATGIEFSFKELKSLKKVSWKKFTIKVESLCIYGSDISKEIKSFKINKSLAKKLSEDLPVLINKTKKKVSKAKNKRIWSTWISKRILRQGLILTLEKEKKYSRDLYKCYEIFSKVYPKKEAEMKKTLELALNPTNNFEELINHLDTFGNWMIKETKRVLA